MKLLFPPYSWGEDPTVFSQVPQRGFPIQRHNELRNLTADLLAEVCKDVAVEPPLESLTDEKLKLASAISSDKACLDVSV